MDAFDRIKQSSLRTHRVTAQVHLSAETFARSVKQHWGRRIVRLDPELSIRFRAIMRLKKTGDYGLKFAYVVDNAEVPDLEFVIFTAYDADMSSWFARKVRVVSKEKEYKYTAKDEQLLLGFDPTTAANDIAAKLADHQDAINVMARKLYKIGLIHVGERHPEMDRNIENPGPFDYAQEMLRACKGIGRIDIGDDAHIEGKTVASLKEGDDAVLKFKLEGDGLKDGTELCFYLTMDALFDSVAVRKIRIRNKEANDYSDSDTDHSLTLDKDPKQAAHELVEQLKNDMFGDVVHEMIMRARSHMSGEHDQFKSDDDDLDLPDDIKALF